MEIPTALISMDGIVSLMMILNRANVRKAIITTKVSELVKVLIVFAKKSLAMELNMMRRMYVSVAGDMNLMEKSVCKSSR